MILTLDAALDGCGAGIVSGGHVLAERRQEGARGSAAALPLMAASLLRETGTIPDQLSAVAVTVGPGSFTGVRAALALGHGIALGAGVPIRGVTVGAAIRALLAIGRPVWVAIGSRRGRVFLDDGLEIKTMGLDALPSPEQPIAVAGDAATAVASRLAARGHDVQFISARTTAPLGIALAAGRPIEARPIYVDLPEARTGVGMRPAPV